MIEVVTLLLGLALVDPQPIDPYRGFQDPTAGHPRIMLKHTWHFTTPEAYPLRQQP